MRKIIAIVFFILIGCNQGPSKKELGNLNGYWEIEKVIFPDGSSKEYKVSLTIDFIELNELNGFRKKVQPRLDGSYITSDDSESFRIIEQKGSFLIHYNQEISKNPLTQRTEELVTLSEAKFSVRNSEGITYFYKRFEPITIGK